MAKILLVNFDKASGMKLSEVLRGKRHEVSLCSDDRLLLRTLRHYSVEMDLIILDISGRRTRSRSLGKYQQLPQ